MAAQVDQTSALTPVWGSVGRVVFHSFFVLPAFCTAFLFRDGFLLSSVPLLLRPVIGVGLIGNHLETPQQVAQAVWMRWLTRVGLVSLHLFPRACVFLTPNVNLVAVHAYFLLFLFMFIS
uniref:Uncharacterized protein n=1 Tax=Trypanosoma vivax (strain Y486) TaxID=1055687 RepID=G0TS23_TRYVY|nr:hypothetical protein TVY486_0201600 [Trypanosoma vivax Y486]